MKRKVWSLLLCACLALSLAPMVRADNHAITAGGWNETLWAEIPGLRDADVTAVSYAGAMSGQLTGQDLEFLVRDGENGVRLDIPGMPAGVYTLTVSTTAGTYVAENIQVEAQDRSGYAHFGYTQGVGAYNDDGTLKENAIVLYVTEENKNTVSVTSSDGTTVSGIGNILNSRGRSSSGGSKTNTNQDILRKLASDGTPLVVRIIGAVTLPEGLTAYNSRDYGGSVGDNGAMARMQGGKDITIEGIGVDATIDGWGLHFICGGGDYARGWGKSFEVRNLTFKNVPEDCVGMEGEQDGEVLNAPVERCWIHHCAFYGPTIANPAESDKAGGDGACDFKRGQYFTNAYCYYEGYHKTNLVGGSDSNLQYHMTYHHNYWKNCESRGPLARQANIHMYNNIFEGQTSYCMNPRANAYIFSEYNLFLNSKNPVRVKLGAVKSFQDSFQGCSGDNHATIVTDRATPVDTDCKYANFDIDPAISYIPQGDYLLHDSISTMQEVVLAQAGPQDGGESGENPGGNGSAGDDVTIAPGSYTHNFTQNGLESEFFSISGNLSTFKGSVTFDGVSLTRCLKLESATVISFTAPESGTLVLVFGGTTDAAGKTIKIDGVRQTIGADNILTVTVMPGQHTITKGDSINLFFMVYTSDSAKEEPHVHSYTSEVTTPATCTETGEMTFTCACGRSYTEEIPATGHSYGQDHICVHCGEPDPDAPPQTQPTEPVTEPTAPVTEPTTAPTVPATEPAATTVVPTVPATEPQPAENNGGGKTVLTVILATIAAGFIVATILELKKKK